MKRTKMIALFVTLALFVAILPSAAFAESTEVAIDLPSILDENPYTMYKEVLDKQEMNTFARVAAIKYPEEELQIVKIIQAFLDAYHQSINTQSEVDLGSFYDLSTTTRQYDYFLSQAYIAGRMITNDDVAKSTSTIKEVTFDWTSIGDANSTDAVNVYLVVDDDEIYDDGQAGFHYGVPHEFTFIKTDDGYKVIRHRLFNVDFTSIQGHLQNNTNFLRSRNTNGFKIWLGEYAKYDDIRHTLSFESDTPDMQDETFSIAPMSITNPVKRDYTDAMRKAAVSYAVTWHLKINTPTYIDFSKEYPGNWDCTNYISQCLHEAGIPFDTYGLNPSGNTAVQWYYRGTSDRTPPWSGAQNFREYLYYNDTTTYGRIGIIANTSLTNTHKSVKIGDIVQIDHELKVVNSGLNKEGYTWDHSLIVTALESDGTDVWYRSRNGGSDVGHGKVRNDYSYAGQRGYWVITGWYE